MTTGQLEIMVCVNSVQASKSGTKINLRFPRERNGQAIKTLSAISSKVDVALDGNSPSVLIIQKLTLKGDQASLDIGSEKVLPNLIEHWAGYIDDNPDEGEGPAEYQVEFSEPQFIMPGMESVVAGVQKLSDMGATISIQESPIEVPDAFTLPAEEALETPDEGEGFVNPFIEPTRENALDGEFINSLAEKPYGMRTQEERAEVQRAQREKELAQG